MQQVSKDIVLATDVAHIVLFHPDDLVHAEHWPIAWYAESFIYPVESAAGRLVAWCTGSDGVFKLRLTTGELTARERAFSGPSFVFPYRSRHGRVFIDNSDGLPGVEKMIDPSTSPDFWFELADGDYAVTVVGGGAGRPRRGERDPPQLCCRFRASRRSPDQTCTKTAGPDRIARCGCPR